MPPTPLKKLATNHRSASFVIPHRQSHRQQQHRPSLLFVCVFLITSTRRTENIVSNTRIQKDDKNHGRRNWTSVERRRQ
jgi:hypothetical protein